MRAQCPKFDDLVGLGSISSTISNVIITLAIDAMILNDYLHNKICFYLKLVYFLYDSLGKFFTFYKELEFYSILKNHHISI